MCKPQAPRLVAVPGRQVPTFLTTTGELKTPQRLSHSHRVQRDGQTVRSTTTSLFGLKLPLRFKPVLLFFSRFIAPGDVQLIRSLSNMFGRNRACCRRVCGLSVRFPPHLLIPCARSAFRRKVRHNSHGWRSLLLSAPPRRPGSTGGAPSGRHLARGTPRPSLRAARSFGGWKGFGTTGLGASWRFTFLFRI